MAHMAKAVRSILIAVIAFPLLAMAGERNEPVSESPAEYIVQSRSVEQARSFVRSVGGTELDELALVRGVLASLTESQVAELSCSQLVAVTENRVMESTVKSDKKDKKKKNKKSKKDKKANKKNKKSKKDKQAKKDKKNKKKKSKKEKKEEAAAIRAAAQQEIKAAEAK